MASALGYVWRVAALVRDHWPAALGLGGLAGVLGTKILPSLFDDWRRRGDAKKAARELIDRNLEPVLKAGDALAAKIRSLAEEDFGEFDEKTTADLVDLAAALFLFAEFWARLEIFRRDSLAVHVSRHPVASKLLDFVRCLEAGRVRLVDRARQRAMGECVMQEAGGTTCIMFRRFVEEYESSERLRTWFEPLSELLVGGDHTRNRQRVLRYGVVVQVLIDELDPKHLSTRARPGYVNKLSKKTRRHLAYAVFREYLPGVEHPEKYCGIRPGAKK